MIPNIDKVFLFVTDMSKISGIDNDNVYFFYPFATKIINIDDFDINVDYNSSSKMAPLEFIDYYHRDDYTEGLIEFDPCELYNLAYNSFLISNNIENLPVNYSESNINFINSVLKIKRDKKIKSLINGK